MVLEVKDFDVEEGAEVKLTLVKDKESFSVSEEQLKDLTNLIKGSEKGNF